MLRQPKKTKFKKYKKGRLSEFEYKKNKLEFGTIGLKAKNSGTISAKSIESARQAIARKVKNQGKLWVRVFSDTPISSKPTEVRMGKGKGSVDHWSAKISAGTVIFELCGANLNTAKSAFKTGSAKLPVKTFVFKAF